MRKPHHLLTSLVLFICLIHSSSNAAPKAVDAGDFLSTEDFDFIKKNEFISSHGTSFYKKRYPSAHPEEVWLLKHPANGNIGDIVREHISGNILSTILKDRVNEVDFIRDLNSTSTNTVGLIGGTKMLEGFQSYSNAFGYIYNWKDGPYSNCMPYGCVIENDKIIERVTNCEPSIIDGVKLKGLEDIVVGSAYVNDQDWNLENIGVIRKGHELEFARVDLGLSLSHLDEKFSLNTFWQGNHWMLSYDNLLKAINRILSVPESQWNEVINRSVDTVAMALGEEGIDKKLSYLTNPIELNGPSTFFGQESLKHYLKNGLAQRRIYLKDISDKMLVEKAIRTNDAEALHALLEKDSSLATTLFVPFGEDCHNSNNGNGKGVPLTVIELIQKLNVMKNFSFILDKISKEEFLKSYAPIYCRNTEIPLKDLRLNIVITQGIVASEDIALFEKFKDERNGKLIGFARKNSSVALVSDEGTVLLNDLATQQNTTLHYEVDGRQYKIAIQTFKESHPQQYFIRIQILNRESYEEDKYFSIDDDQTLIVTNCDTACHTLGSEGKSLFKIVLKGKREKIIPVQAMDRKYRVLDIDATSKLTLFYKDQPIISTNCERNKIIEKVIIDEDRRLLVSLKFRYGNRLYVVISINTEDAYLEDKLKQRWLDITEIPEAFRKKLRPVFCKNNIEIEGNLFELKFYRGAALDSDYPSSQDEQFLGLVGENSEIELRLADTHSKKELARLHLKNIQTEECSVPYKIGDIQYLAKVKIIKRMDDEGGNYFIDMQSEKLETQATRNWLETALDCLTGLLQGELGKCIASKRNIFLSAEAKEADSKEYFFIENYFNFELDKGTSLESSKMFLNSYENSLGLGDENSQLIIKHNGKEIYRTHIGKPRIIQESVTLNDGITCILNISVGFCGDDRISIHVHMAL